MSIRKLPAHIVNQIAAGEVVERPASVLKELVENSLDAGAQKVHVNLSEGGQSLIQVIDDGGGMSLEDMRLSVERHATSKLPADDLFAIHTMGFRGEALSSIASVSRLLLTTRQPGSDQGWGLSVEGGEMKKPAPAAWEKGTKVDVRDLFYAIPARLKFLKKPKTELTHCLEFFHRLAMGHPEVSFRLQHEGKVLFERPAESYLDRASSVVGASFQENALQVRAEREGMTLTGFLGLPTENRSSQKMQYLYVNGRCVKDRGIAAALKGAYGDLIPRDRFPVFVLFLTLPSREVDVNVHPAKTEIRFVDAYGVKRFLTAVCRDVLFQESQRSGVVVPLQPGHQNPLKPVQEMGKTSGYSWERTRPGGRAALSPPPRSSKEYKPVVMPLAAYGQTTEASSVNNGRERTELNAPPSYLGMREVSASSVSEERLAVGEIGSQPAGTDFGPQIVEDKAPSLGMDLPLGQVKGQVFNTYILCETQDSLVIVDQHAAHERLMYEQMKQEIKAGGVRRQMLLVPEFVDLSPHHADSFDPWLAALETMGLMLEKQGAQQMLVKEVPAVMKDFDIQKLVQDLAAEIEEHENVQVLEAQIDHLLATFSCHGSIRAGRRLNEWELDQLLRQMEETAFSGQCNHGRPSYIRLTRKDLENFFERS